MYAKEFERQSQNTSPYPAKRETFTFKLTLLILPAKAHKLWIRGQSITSDPLPHQRPFHVYSPCLVECRSRSDPTSTHDL